MVPTLIDDVKRKLRSLGEPVRLFGENLADVRERLRMCMGTLKVLGRSKGDDMEVDGVGGDGEAVGTEGEDHAASARTEVVYTEASKSLVEARKKIATFSIERARKRLLKERERRSKTRKRLDDDSSSAAEDEFFYLKRENVVGGIPEEEDYASALFEKVSGQKNASFLFFGIASCSCRARAFSLCAFVANSRTLTYARYLGRAKNLPLTPQSLPTIGF